MELHQGRAANTLLIGAEPLRRTPGWLPHAASLEMVLVDVLDQFRFGLLLPPASRRAALGPGCRLLLRAEPLRIDRLENRSAAFSNTDSIPILR